MESQADTAGIIRAPDCGGQDATYFGITHAKGRIYKRMHRDVQHDASQLGQDHWRLRAAETIALRARVCSVSSWPIHFVRLKEPLPLAGTLGPIYDLV
jgi:hypothetical protein